MYNLPYFKENDPTVILDFMKQHSFALLIGADAAGYPVATQIPVLIVERNGQLYLQGHIMKGTDHHRAFEQHSRALFVFTGPHTYVSASWYSNRQQASTWNYMSVHAKGELRFLEQDELLQMLDDTTALYENNPASPSLYKNLPEAYVLQLAKAIVAFEVKVDSIEHVFKLSQNRDRQSYDTIISQLSEGNADAKAIALEMEKRKAQLFPL